MDVRIGLAQTQRELVIELPDDVKQETIADRVKEALQDEDNVLDITDRKGKLFCVPAGRIAFVEIGSSETDRRVGFTPGS
jgi:hypothetical protein